jgi:5'-nucleotidase
MIKISFDKANRKYTYIIAVGITVLVFLMLMGIAGTAQFAGIQTSSSNNVPNFNKFDKAINAYEKAIEINPPNSLTKCDLADVYHPINKKDDIVVQILAINDFHGQLEPLSSQMIIGHNKTSNIYGDVGGAEYVAAHIKKLKSTNPNTIVVSAGDNIGASPLISAHFNDEPTIIALNMMGVEFSAIGNHEFDKGLDKLICVQKGGCNPKDDYLGNSSFEGAHFHFLAANLVNESTNSTIFPAYNITYVQGVPIGFIGIALENTPTTVSPLAVKGLKFLNETETINKYVKKLKDMGIKIIVVLIHDGGVSQDKDALYNEQLNITKSSHILDVVKHTDRAVTIFITGHTHQAYNTLIDNHILTQAYAHGTVLTDINLTISNKTHTVIEKSVKNIIVSRNIPIDSEVIELVAKYKCLIAPLANKVIGNITDNITAIPNDSGESTLGDLIADAQLYATSNPNCYGGAVVAFTNPGGIRSNLILSGSKLPANITYSEAFSVQPFGDNLVTMTLNGTQIDTLLEQQFDNTYFGDKDRLQVSKGFSYTWNKNAPLGKKVKISSIKINGTSIDPISLYRVTLDSFLAEGGDDLSILRAGINRTRGSLDLNATVDYFNHFSPVSSGPRDRIAVVE